MLTVRELVADLDLTLVAGEAGADAPVRWVHSSELTDPTPWLSGGELLLTTGLSLREVASQREFVHLLSEHHLAGLGFGTGFDHAAVPPALLAEAEAHGFPVFEVPYELPFIAITERAFATLVNEQHAVLQRAIGVQRRLERLVLEERGLGELARALAAAAGGAVAVLDEEGRPLARAAFRRELPEQALEEIGAELRARAPNGSGKANGGGEELSPRAGVLAGRCLVTPVSVARSGAPDAWVLITRDAGGIGELERLLAHGAAIAVALELMRTRTMRDTERRLAGDVVGQALAGTLDDHEVAARLAPFGIGARAAVLVLAGAAPGLAAPDGGSHALEAALAQAGARGLVTRRDELLCAVLDCSNGSDPVDVAASARAALEGREGALRAGVSRSAPTARLRLAFHEARCALEATRLRGGDVAEVATWRDLGTFQLLLSLQDDEGLRLYCESVLGPLRDEAGEYGDELLRSVEAFIEHNGQWERAARELPCHRHTLRYRMRRVEELTGRDLSSARDRIELWLALRARELVA